MRQIKDLALAMLVGFVVAYVAAVTPQASLPRTLLLGATGTGVAWLALTGLEHRREAWRHLIQPVHTIDRRFGRPRLIRTLPVLATIAELQAHLEKAQVIATPLARVAPPIALPGPPPCDQAGEKQFVSATISDLNANFAGLTRVRLDQHFSTEPRCKWLRVSGPIGEFTREGNGGVVTISELIISRILNVELHFGPEFVARLDLMAKGQTISAQGQVVAIARIFLTVHTLRLDACEIVSA
jgi:hypothetical protein